MVSAESQIMASNSNNMETEVLQQEQPCQPMEVVAKAPPPPPQPAEADTSSPVDVMDVPEQIVVDKKEKKKERKSSKSHRHRKSSGSKEKVAKKHSSSSGKHDGKRHSSKERKERRRRRKHRKSKELDPNDPEVMKKSRELLLAAMGVKKQPDIAPCFVSANSSLDNNPVYQSNKKRISSLAHSQSESALSKTGSRASFTMDTTGTTTRSADEMAGLNGSAAFSMDGTTSSSPGDSANEESEYDQYVEF